MPTYVIVLREKTEAEDLLSKLLEQSTPIIQSKLIVPQLASNVKQNLKKEPKGIPNSDSKRVIALQPTDIEEIQILNPKFSRDLRQKTMAFWLMPFGFIAGLTFTLMTQLDTFATLGLGAKAEPLIGGFLGMGSGWIGSYIAASSVRSDKKDDIKNLRNQNSKGFWLFLIETPREIEIPWKAIRDVNPINTIVLEES